MLMHTLSSPQPRQDHTLAPAVLVKSQGRALVDLTVPKLLSHLGVKLLAKKTVVLEAPLSRIYWRRDLELT